MKINVLEQRGTRTEQRTRIIPATYDEDGNILTEERTETYEVEVPVMVSVTRDMTAEEEAEIKEQETQQYNGISYEDLVTQFIREKYSLNDELALSRQRDTKAEEFNTYYEYCEACKMKAKEIKGIN